MSRANPGTALTSDRCDGPTGRKNTTMQHQSTGRLRGPTFRLKELVVIAAFALIALFAVGLTAAQAQPADQSTISAAAATVIDGGPVAVAATVIDGGTEVTTVVATIASDVVVAVVGTTATVTTATIGFVVASATSPQAAAVMIAVLAAIALTTASIRSLTRERTGANLSAFNHFDPGQALHRAVHGLVRFAKAGRFSATGQNLFLSKGGHHLA